MLHTVLEDTVFRMALFQMCPRAKWTIIINHFLNLEEFSTLKIIHKQVDTSKQHCQPILAFLRLEGWCHYMFETAGEKPCCQMFVEKCAHGYIAAFLCNHAVDAIIDI